MDLMTLNNQIVALRPLVRRSKLHVVRKLTRNLQKVKQKRGTDDQKVKNQRKADRLTLEINEIKKINLDEVARFALENRNDKVDPKKLRVKELTTRKLAAFKPILQKVQKFRELFPNWESELAILLQMKDVRKKYKNPKNKKTSLQKKTIPKKLVKSQLNKKSVNLTIPIETKTPLTRKNKVEMQKPEDNTSVNNNSSVVIKPQEPIVQVAVKEKIEGEMEIKKLSLNDLAEETNKSNIKNNIVKEKTNTTAPSVKDNFFLTGDSSGEASVDGDESDKDSLNSEPVSPLPRQTFKRRNVDSRFSTEFPKKSLRRDQISSERLSERKPLNRKIPSKDISSIKGKDEFEDETIHPSWQAKKILKNQSSIQKFEGKKILFDD